MKKRGSGHGHRTTVDRRARRRAAWWWGPAGAAPPKDASGRQAAEQPAAASDPGAATAPDGGTPADAGAPAPGTDAAAAGSAAAATGGPAGSGATPAPGSPKPASAAGSSSGDAANAAKPGAKTASGGASSGSGGGASGAASTGGGVAPAPGLPGSPAPAPAAGGPCAPMSIGTWGTTTGPIGALFGAMTPAAKAWVASVNSRGGLGGCHQVKLIVGDDGDDPAKAKAIVKKMVEEDSVTAFVAHHGALTLGAVRPYLEQKRVPLFGSSGAYADESESEMVFLAQPTSVVGESEAYINNVLALNFPQRKIAVFWCAEVPLCSVHNDVIKKQAAAKGFRVVASIRISLFAPDYTSEVLQARQSGADMIVLLTDMQTNGRLLRSANRQDYKPLVVTPGVNYDTQWPDIIGRDADGMITTAWSRPWHIVGINREYREAMGRYQPGQVMGNSGSAAWAGMKLVEKAAANLDRDKADVGAAHPGRLQAVQRDAGRAHPADDLAEGPEAAGRVAPCTVPVRWTGTAFELPLGERFVCSAPGPVSGSWTERGAQCGRRSRKRSVVLGLVLLATCAISTAARRRSGGRLGGQRPGQRRGHRGRHHRRLHRRPVRSEWGAGRAESRDRHAGGHQPGVGALPVGDRPAVPGAVLRRAAEHPSLQRDPGAGAERGADLAVDGPVERQR